MCRILYARNAVELVVPVILRCFAAAQTVNYNNYMCTRVLIVLPTTVDYNILRWKKIYKKGTDSWAGLCCKWEVGSVGAIEKHVIYICA